MSTLRRFKPYPAYKDSGVEWLGEIPAHWEVKRLKFVAHIEAGQSPPSEMVADGSDGLPFLQGNADFGPMSPAPRQVCDAAPKRAQAGDILLSVRAPVGAMNVADQPYGIGRGLCAVRLGACVDPRFGYYALVTTRTRLDSVATGSTYDAVTTSHVGDLPALLPSPPEQRAIAAFLDRETTRIDALVAKKERLIELLLEQRTALITRAVTKGLDPNVPMKDSGVEWLGEIPAHWEVLALKRRTKRIQTGTTPPTSETKYYEDGTVAWYGPGSFGDDLPLQAPMKFISESAVVDGAARVFESGSAVVVTIGATIGKVAFMEQPGSCNQQITGVTFDAARVHAKYGAYQLKSFEPVLRGIAPNTTLPILDQEEVGYLPLVVPPPFEQRAIAAFLGRETGRIDALVAKVREGIERLKEYRTALISAAVTGKIDVREA